MATWDPTVAGYDGFWNFVALRMEAWHLKQKGLRSSDQVLASGHYPNVMRELDPGTIYFHERVKACPQHVFTMSVVYRLINRRQTFIDFGGIPFSRSAMDAFRIFLLDRSGESIPIFTGRHQTRGLKQYFQTLDFLEGPVWNGGRWVLESIREAEGSRKPEVDTPDVVWRKLQDLIPGVSKFFAWQICCDLIEAGLLPDLDKSYLQWAYMGPGPQGALQLIAGHRVKQKDALAAARAMAAGSSRRPVSWPPEPYPQQFSVKNIEHAMCEYFRYTREWQRIAG